MKQNIFICHARTERHDQDCVDMVIAYLKPIVDQHNASHPDDAFIIWHDRGIDLGVRWEDAIHRAIENARIAIILLGPQLLASEFVQHVELPQLLDRARVGDVQLLVLVIQHVSREAHSELHERQAVNDWRTPLVSLTDDQRGRVFVKLSEQVQRLLNAPRDQEPVKFAPSTLPRRDFVFTGRDAIMKDIEFRFGFDGRPQALTGMLLSGKSAVALAFAHKSRKRYSGGRFWVDAKTDETIKAGFLAICQEVYGTSHGTRSSADAVRIAKAWLDNNDDWLLIFDGVEDIELARRFVPDNDRGHVLLTTRLADTGFARRVKVTMLDPEEGAILLLQRAKIADKSDVLSLHPDKEAASMEISKELGGLPWALVQAGATIEKRKLSIHEYLSDLKAHGPRILFEESDGGAPSLKEMILAEYEKVATNALAADLLLVCAHFAEAPIPDASFYGAEIEGHFEELKDVIDLGKLISVAGKQWLIDRDSNELLHIPRLVKTCLKELRDPETYATRVVRAVDYSINQSQQAKDRKTRGAFNEWNSCLIQHAINVARQLIRYDVRRINVDADCASNIGYYLHRHKELRHAEKTYQWALRRCELDEGKTSPKLLPHLRKLAKLKYDQKQLEETATVYRRIEAILIEHDLTANRLVVQDWSNLSTIYGDLGDVEKAYRYQLKSFANRQKHGMPCDGARCRSYLSKVINHLSHEGKYEQAMVLLEEFEVFCRTDTAEQPTEQSIHEPPSRNQMYVAASVQASYLRACVYLKMGEEIHAYDCFREAIEFSNQLNDSSEAMNVLVAEAIHAISHLKRGR